MKELTTKFSEPTWLADSRLEAWEAYLQTPMPTDRDEAWRRTDVAALDLTRLQAAIFPSINDGKNAQTPKWFEETSQHFPSTAGLLCQSTTGGVNLKLSPEAEKQGVIFCDLATAVEKHADKLKKFVQSALDQGKFTLLTRALFNCGAFLYVPRNVDVKDPFLFGLDFSVNPSDTETGAAAFPRVIVIAEDNSRVDVVFTMGSADRKTQTDSLSLASSLVEFHVKPGARVNYLEVQAFTNDVFYVQRLNSEVERDGSFNSLTVALGGKQTKADIATFLKAPGATSSVLGVVLGAKNEKFSYNTIQEHNAPDTTSDINFRVAVKDNSTSVYQGIIRVDKIAQRTNAFQSNKNLLLGGEAKADSIPKLEILADDVKCSHGATVGPVDREQLFYLRSRGLTPTEAEELVVLGFFRQVMEQFPLTGAMEWLSDVVSQKVFRACDAPSKKGKA